jgi:hypothetical protein
LLAPKQHRAVYSTQRKLSNGRERLVAGFEPYYVYEQKENRPTLSVGGRASGIRTQLGAFMLR